MRAEVLTRALGGRWHRTYGLARCPAHDDRHPSLSLRDGEDGKLLLYCHAGCEFRDVLAAVGSFSPDLGSEPPDNLRGRGTKPSQSLSNLISLIWSQCVAIQGSFGERYLRARSINSALPASLRFHPRLRHPTGQHLPAMVGKVEHVRNGFVGLHRTYLKATRPMKTALDPNKAMLGPCKGGAVRIRRGQQGLAVCEGIETALSIAAGLDHGAAIWAGLSISGAAGLELPSPDQFAGRLLICADGDPAGRQAGHRLADRAAALAWKVEIERIGEWSVNSWLCINYS